MATIRAIQDELGLTGILQDEATSSKIDGKPKVEHVTH